VDERVFPTTVAWRTSAPKDSMSLEGTYFVEDVAILNARRTPIQKQPETLFCLVGLSRRYYLGDDVYPIFLHDDGREMDLFNLISAPNPTVIKTGTRPRAAHEVPLLTVIASRQIDMEEPVATSESFGAPSTLERHLLQVTPAGTMNPDPISFAKPSSVPEQDIAQSSKGATAAGGPESDPSSPTIVMSPGGIYQPEWGVTNGCRLDTPSSCQELVDHLAPPGYFSELRHLPNEEFLGQFNMTLARQVAMGSQLRLRFEQEAKLLRKSVAQVARRDQRIQAMEGEKKNLETLLEAEADMRKAAEAKNAELVKEMESLRAQFTELQVSRDGLSHQVSTLQAQVTGEEKIKAAFEEFKKYEDERVSARCAEMDSRLDALSIDFDEELYPHMLTAIAGRRWVIGHGLRLAVLKCAESLELRHTFANVVSAGIIKGFCDRLKYAPTAEVELGEAKVGLELVEGYDLEAEGKIYSDMQALKGSDGVPVYVPTAVPQGLAILLADAATQTDVSEVNSSPQLTRSKSLPSCKTLD
ncbi:hypothetical protein Tco_0551059, partial [Tanacetum coccineum]